MYPLVSVARSGKPEKIGSSVEPVILNFVCKWYVIAATMEVIRVPESCEAFTSMIHVT